MTATLYAAQCFPLPVLSPCLVLLPTLHTRVPSQSLRVSGALLDKSSNTLLTTRTIFLTGLDDGAVLKAGKGGFGVSEVAGTASLRCPAPGRAQSDYADFLLRYHVVLWAHFESL